MVAAKKKAADVKSWQFSAKTSRGTEYHLVFATSKKAARRMLEDRYLGKHAMITSLKPKKPVKE
jgi:hypothetical protein